MVRFLLLFLFSMPVLALDFGVNIKNFDKIDQVIALLKKRNFKTVRINLDLNSGTTSAIESATRLREAGIHVEAVLLPNMQYNNQCSQNFTKVRQDAYDETYSIVNKFKHAIYDYELLNESSLRPWLLAEVGQNTGELASNYTTNKPCYASLAAGLDGMADAIDDIRTASSLPLRIILGLVGRDYGFGLFMINTNSVKVDVIGYHIYSTFPSALYSTDTFWGYGTNTLYARLAQFNKPVRINEFDCAEIYGAYDNVVDSTNTTDCNKAIKKHVADMMAQTSFTLESISFYELHDEPEKSSPENKFGLTYNIHTPKLQLATAAALSGGWISLPEKNKLISQSIMTCQEIVNFKNSAYYDPLKVTVPNVTTCN